MGLSDVFKKKEKEETIEEEMVEEVMKEEMVGEITEFPEQDTFNEDDLSLNEVENDN